MRRHLAEREGSAVEALAEETIPRDVVDGRTPSVRPELWKDHVLFARTGDSVVLDRLVREYERYARSLAGRMDRGNEPREDLDQMALEALVIALRRFEPERGIPFPAYATPTIIGALRRHYRDHGWLVRVSRRVHEFAHAQRETADRLTVELGRNPTDIEIAAAMGIDLEDLLLAQEALHARDTRSIDAPVGDALSLEDRLGEEDPDLGMAEDRLAADAALSTLDDSERRLIRLYYLEERSQSEVAAFLGVSQMQVSRLLRSTMRRLKARSLPVNC